MLILERPWTRQPQTHVPAASNSLTPRWLWTASRGLYTPERIAGTIPTNAGGSILPSPNGLAYVGVAGSGNGLGFGTARQAIQSNSTEHTILCFAAPVAGATGLRQSLFTQGSDGSGFYTQYTLLADATGSAGSYTTGHILYAHYDAGVVKYKYTTSSGAVDGNWHVFVATRSGTEVTLYRDGIALSAGDSGSGGAGLNAITGSARVSGADGSSRVCTGSNALVAVWSRALSNAEVVTVSRNVWQLFAPRHIYIPTATAAATSRALHRSKTR